MVLKRSDLAKKFDLVVQQEIKNHNDSILATNISINDLYKKIEILSQISAENIAGQERKIKKLEKEFKDLSDKYDNLDYVCKASLNDFETTLNHFEEVHDSIIDSISSEKVDKLSFADFKQENMILLDEINQKIRIQKEYIHSAIHKLMCDSASSFDDFKKKLFEKPDNSLEVKKELEKKIESAIVDAEGILREIKISRKDIFIIEKKIENLYTLIERLKRGES